MEDWGFSKKLREKKLYKVFLLYCPPEPCAYSSCRSNIILGESIEKEDE